MNNIQSRIADCTLHSRDALVSAGVNGLRILNHKTVKTRNFTLRRKLHEGKVAIKDFFLRASVPSCETSSFYDSISNPKSTIRNPQWSIFVICLSSVICFLISASPAKALSGREVYEKVHEVRSKQLDRKTEATMVLFDKGGGKRTRTLVEYSKKADPEAYKVLVVFKTPPDLKNVGFLIHAHTFSDRDLWAYFPEYRRVRRIATSSQDDSFFGSDFSYDDFGGPPNLDDYKFSILREETFDNKACYVVEVTPRIRRKYTKYVAWVAKDLWIQVKVDYYQDKDVYRSGEFTDVRIIENIPTPFKLNMENKKTAHRTELTIESIQYHTRFKDDLFSQRSLERAGK